MLVGTMFKKFRIDVSFWFLASVIGMAVCYLFVSNKDFEMMINEPLNWILHLEYDWDTLILIALIVYWVLVLIYHAYRIYRGNRKQE